MFSRARRGAALLSVAALLGLAACASGTAPTLPAASALSPASIGAGAADGTRFPVTVDSCGRSFTYTRPPTRVVLGYPRSLETLNALGVGDSVYGYTLGSYDALPAGYPPAIVEVSPDYAPAREAMIAARPDLYLANDEGQVSGEGTVSHDDLAAIGANVYVLGQYCSNGDSPTSLDAVYDDITALGSIFGVPERARQLTTDLRQRVSAAAARNDGPSLRVGFLQVYDGHIYANGGYPASGIIGALGLTNEFGDLPGSFTELTTEEALLRRPDVLFVNYVGAGQEPAAVEAVRTTLPDLPAVRDGRVYGFDETDFQAGGVTIIDGLEYVADTAIG